MVAAASPALPPGRGALRPAAIRPPGGRAGHQVEHLVKRNIGATLAQPAFKGFKNAQWDKAADTAAVNGKNKTFFLGP